MDLLKQKRDALLIEFMSRHGRDAAPLRLAAEDRVARRSTRSRSPRRSTARVALRSAGLATKGEIVVDMTGTKIMGVSVPVVTKGESPIRSVVHARLLGHRRLLPSRRDRRQVRAHPRRHHRVRRHRDAPQATRRGDQQDEPARERARADHRAGAAASRSRYIQPDARRARARGPVPAEEGQEEDREEEAGARRSLGGRRRRAVPSGLRDGANGPGDWRRLSSGAVVRRAVARWRCDGLD